MPGFNELNGSPILKYACDELAYYLKRHGRVLVIGRNATGKTTLINFFLKLYGDDYPRKIYISETETQRDFDFKKIRADLSNFKRSLIVIDRDTSYFSNESKEQLLRIFMEGRKYGINILMSAYIDDNVKPFLSQAEIYRTDQIDKKIARNLIVNELKSLGWNKDDIEKLLQSEPFLKDSLLSISNLARLISQMSSEGQDGFGALVGSVNYESTLFAPSKHDTKILLPEQKKIITDIKLIEKDILRLLHNHPKEIYKLSSREFEELVVDIYRRKGFNVTLTKATRDGGKDFIISNPGLLGDQLIYGECKKNSPERAISINVIKQLHSTVVTDKATSGIIVSSSYFSPDAIRYAENFRHQMSLVDFVKLKEMIKEIV